MDTVIKNLVDPQRAKDIFARLNYRMSQERIKTNEKYLEFLIDEINKYFSDISTSTINASNLPSDRTGPDAEQHNKLITDIANDIDKIHRKRVEVQNVITKAVNFLSTERVSINNAVSKIHNRIINHKITSASNDRRVTVFNEYFTDDQFMDPKLSRNVRVDTTLSALTLSPVRENKDNSNLIQPESIFLKVINRDAVTTRRALYPLSSQPLANSGSNEGGYFFGFGRILSNSELDNSNTNLIAAGIDSANYSLIQNQCLINGDVPEDQMTFGEFELVFNDFASGKMQDAIRLAVKKSPANSTGFSIADPNSILMPSNVGGSFRNVSFKDGDKTDFQTLKDLIKEAGIRFKLKSNVSRSGISYITIRFAPADTTLVVPNIDYANSYIKDTDGVSHKVFEPVNTISNDITEDKSLLLTRSVPNPIEVFIALDISHMQVTPIKSYKGLCWKYKIKGVDVFADFIGAGSTPRGVTASTGKLRYVYNDPIRASDWEQIKALNNPVAESIISTYANNQKLSEDIIN